MFKFIKKSSFTFVLFLSSFAVNATPIDYRWDASLLTDDYYITVDHGSGNFIDWAWVSSESVNLSFDDFDIVENTFYAPNSIDGWRLATDSEFSYFLQFYSSINFRNTPTDPGNGSDTYKMATYFWNDNAAYHDVVNASDFDDGYITSSWEEGTYYEFGGTSFYDTFYVRDHQSQPVSEPSTLLIFAMGLIALASKKKLFS